VLNFCLPQRLHLVGQMYRTSHNQRMAPVLLLHCSVQYRTKLLSTLQLFASRIKTLRFHNDAVHSSLKRYGISLSLVRCRSVCLFYVRSMSYVNISMRIRFCITTAATATVFQRRNVCYDVPLHVWEMGLLLQQDTDCGSVSQQNCDNLTSPSDNSVGR